MRSLQLFSIALAGLLQHEAAAQTCDFQPKNANQGSTLCPPQAGRDQDIILELGSTFPARFGSFSYELFPCDQYYMYTFVSVEDSNSKPLEQGLRGLFVQTNSSEDV